MNVLDVAQNSVSAGASLIAITVEEDSAADRLTIAIEDNGKGMSPETVRKVTDPFYTTRTTRRVGLGVPFFKMAAELTGGSFRIHSREGEGTAVRAEFVRSSIDRMPLGDMCSTMLSLIGCNPDRDFVYTYTVDGRSFAADTREFRQILEGIPLSDPQVLGFIREYLEENIAEAVSGSGGESPSRPKE